jgi:hypothetical protein
VGPELPDFHSGEGVQELAWRIVELTVSPEVTGIVKSDLFPDSPRKLQFPFGLEISQELGIVNDFPFSPEFRILILEAPKTVGGGRDDFGHSPAVKELNIRFRQPEKELLVPDFPDAFAAAALFVPDHSKAYSRSLEELDDTSGDLCAPGIVTGVTADEEKVFRIGAKPRNVQSFLPGDPFLAGTRPGVPVGVGASED